MSTKEVSQTERNALAKHTNSLHPQTEDFNIDEKPTETLEEPAVTSPSKESVKKTTTPKTGSSTSAKATPKTTTKTASTAKPKAESTAAKTTTKTTTKATSTAKPKAESTANKESTKSSTATKATTKTTTAAKPKLDEGKEPVKKTTTKASTPMPANRSAVVIKKSDIIKKSSVAKQVKANETKATPVPEVKTEPVKVVQKVSDVEKERLMREQLKEELRKELMEELKAEEAKKVVKAPKEENLNLPPIKSNEQILRERLLQEQILSEQARREQIIQETINKERLAKEKIAREEIEKSNATKEKQIDNLEYTTFFDNKEPVVENKKSNDEVDYSSFFTPEKENEEVEESFVGYGEFSTNDDAIEEKEDIKEQPVEKKLEEHHLRLELEIERARNNKTRLKDESIIAALKIDRTANDEKELLDFCNKEGFLARSKVVGYFITLAYNKKTTLSYEDIVSVLGQYIIIVANYHAIRIDLANNVNRNLRAYLKNIKLLDKKSIFYELGKIFINNHIHSIETESNISHLTSRFNFLYRKNYKHLSNLEVNEFMMLLFDCHCTKGKLNNDIYQSLYKKNLEKLTPETCEYCLCDLANCYLRNGDFKKARKTYEEALIYNPNNFEVITHVILMRYKCRTFEELYKKRSFSRLHEFKEILERAERENNEELKEKYYEFENEAKAIETKMKYKALGIYRTILLVLGILGALTMFIVSYVTNHTKAWEWYYYAIFALAIVGSGFITNNFKKAIVGIIIRILIAVMIMVLWYYLGNVLGFFRELFDKLNILPQFESKTNYFIPREPLF